MSPLFGKKKSDQKTVAIFDIENGSVGGALVRLRAGLEPSLFVQTRASLPMRRSVSAQDLLRDTDTALTDVLSHISRVAARLRVSSPGADSPGVIAHVAVFLHAPWVEIFFDSAVAKTRVEEPLLASLREQLQAVLGDVRVSFHAFGTTAAPLAHTAVGEDEQSLVLSVTGEVTELFVTDHGALMSIATVPHGTHTLVRTLQSHAGLSPEEAHSLLSLMQQGSDHHPQYEEPLLVGTNHLLQEIGSAAGQLAATFPIRHMLVIAPHNTASLLARMSTTHDTLATLFPEGSTVRDVRAFHLSPHVTLPKVRPDIPLSLEALFAERRFGVY